MNQHSDLKRIILNRTLTSTFFENGYNVVTKKKKKKK